jgi:hypothetical protein
MPFEDWECDHVIPLIAKPGGNRESNLAPALVAFHRKKTAKPYAPEDPKQLSEEGSAMTREPRLIGSIGPGKTPPAFDKYRRYLSEILLHLSVSLAPMQSDRDLDYGRHLHGALRVALEDAQRRVRR